MKRLVSRSTWTTGFREEVSVIVSIPLVALKKPPVTVTEPKKRWVAVVPVCEY